jgi:hypothetical protein
MVRVFIFFWALPPLSILEERKNAFMPASQCYLWLTKLIPSALLKDDRKR